MLGFYLLMVSDPFFLQPLFPACVQIVPLDDALVRKALALFAQRLDKE
jgi:hypothetical protein